MRTAYMEDGGVGVTVSMPDPDTLEIVQHNADGSINPIVIEGLFNVNDVITSLLAEERQARRNNG